jgi:hypothetical protein
MKDGKNEFSFMKLRDEIMRKSASSTPDNSEEGKKLKFVPNLNVIRSVVNPVIESEKKRSESSDNVLSLQQSTINNNY